MFENYLRDIHAETYMGTDDDMPENYEKWLTNLDSEEIIDYGNEFAEFLFKQIPVIGKESTPVADSIMKTIIGEK